MKFLQILHIFIYLNVDYFILSKFLKVAAE